MFKSRINVLLLGIVLVVGWQSAIADTGTDPYLEQARAMTWYRASKTYRAIPTWSSNCYAVAGAKRTSPS